MLAAYQPPPPEGAGSPLDWGREEHVRGLLGDDFELRFVHRQDPWPPEYTPEELWQLMVTSFGPLKTLNDMLEEPRREELHGDFVAYFDARRVDGRVEAPREYLVTIGTRR
jgi:hypothetical protein